MPPLFRPPALVHAELESTFPNLARSTWSVKSPFDKSYNCFAWAACDEEKRWEPILPPIYYWPSSVARQLTIECFIEAFATMGYEPCGDASFEFGFQKVAIYADADMTPTHMARQHFFGCGWLSKLGDLEDIFHRELIDVEGDTSPTSQEYGRVVQVLKRSWWTAARFGLFRGWWAGFKFWIYRLAHP